MEKTVPLPRIIDKTLFLYTQVYRKGMIAIYTQTHKPSGVIRYEVIRIKIQQEHTWPTGHISPECEAYPGSNSWGQLGWTFFQMSDAQAHVQRLQERAYAHEA